MNQETIPITLWMAGRDYRLKIDPKDEEIIRKAAKVADQRQKELRKSYHGKDNQDFVAMCLLLYAAEQATDDNSFDAAAKNILQDMAEDIDKALKK